MQLEVFIDELNEWVDLVGIEDFEELRDKAGDCVYVSDVDSDFRLQMEGCFLIEDLEDLQGKINDIEEWCEEEAFKALIEYYDDFDDAYECCKHENFCFYPDVQDEEDLGRYIVDEGLWGEIPDNLVNYIDYEAIGRDVSLNANGRFTDNGFIEVH